MLYRFFEGTHKGTGFEFRKQDEIFAVSSYTEARKELDSLIKSGYTNILVEADLGVRDLLFPRSTMNLFEVLEGKLETCELGDFGFIEVELKNGIKKGFKSVHKFCKWWDNFELNGGIATVRYSRYVSNTRNKKYRMETVTLVKVGEKTNVLPNWNFGKTVITRNCASSEYWV